MIKKEEVKHIAKLARLGMTEKEEELFQKHLSGILDYFNFLKKAETQGVKPTFHANEQFLKEEETMREDVSSSQSPETVGKLIKDSPDKKDNYIKVKAIL